LATADASDSTNHARRAPDGPRGQGNYVDGPRKSFAGGAGLISTAADYARCLEMLRNGGELGGVRILAPHTVDLMTHNQVGMLFDSTGARGFGFGFQITERYGANGMASVGTFSWGGAYGSGYSVDPVEHLVIVFMINQLPNRSDSAGPSVQRPRGRSRARAPRTPPRRDVPRNRTSARSPAGPVRRMRPPRAAPRRARPCPWGPVLARAPRRRAGRAAAPRPQSARVPAARARGTYTVRSPGPQRSPPTLVPSRA